VSRGLRLAIGTDEEEKRKARSGRFRFSSRAMTSRLGARAIAQRRNQKPACGETIGLLVGRLYTSKKRTTVRSLLRDGAGVRMRRASGMRGAPWPKS
jgi:hypothetical protein